MTVQQLPATPPLLSVAEAQQSECPVLAFQTMISGKYKIRILWDLKDGPRRYGEIRASLLSGAAATKEIAPRVLSRELKALAAAGLIARKDYAVVPPKVEYRLTEAGASFAPIIATIREWGERHLSGSTASHG
jgi:DNA-binding HxlR family transcriptional regulator